jgi:hypothetical protein
MKVYIAYSSDTKEEEGLIKELNEHFYRENIETFVPDYTATSKSDILKNLNNSDLVLGIYMRKFAGCPWLNQQLGYAEALEKPIVILTQDKTRLAPLLINKPKIEFNGHDHEKVIADAIMKIKENVIVSINTN